MSQMSFIKKHLEEDGYISRNYCLQNYISRLGARIDDLKKEGWDFRTEIVKTASGKDFRYYVIKPSTGILTPKPIQDRLIGLNLPSGNTYKSHYGEG